MGAKFLLKIFVASCLEGLIGITEAGSSRFGKYEIRGVPGGGRIRENSGARDVNGVCFVESATIMLVLRSRSVMRDCGVISFAKSK